jgi:hypothetical protein
MATNIMTANCPERDLRRIGVADLRGTTIPLHRRSRMEPPPPYARFRSLSTAQLSRPSVGPGLWLCQGLAGAWGHRRSKARKGPHIIMLGRFEALEQRWTVCRHDVMYMR